MYQYYFVFAKYEIHLLALFFSKGSTSSRFFLQNSGYFVYAKLVSTIMASDALLHGSDSGGMGVLVRSNEFGTNNN